MKNKLFKSALVCLVVISVMVAVVSSWAVWHQPVTPSCVA